MNDWRNITKVMVDLVGATEGRLKTKVVPNRDIGNH